jgi:hypothetical protein
MSQHAPHQTANDKRYYMRAGSSFLPVPHAVLAGMFGRRPNPTVWHNWIIAVTHRVDSIHADLGLLLFNNGPGIAENLFANVLIESLPGDNCSAGFRNPDANAWFGNFSFGRQLSLILRDGLRLPPQARLQPTIIEIEFKPPFDAPLRISGCCGASGSQTFPLLLHQGPGIIDTAFTHSMALLNSNEQADAMPSFSRSVFPELLAEWLSSTSAQKN